MGIDARSCAEVRPLISAATDDELDQADTIELSEHLDGCADCRRYADRIATLTRTVRVRSVAVEPDFVERVMSPNVRLGRGVWLRPALAWCGLVILASSIRPLVFADLDDAPTHIARHVGAFAAALGVGLLYAAWRPHRAFGLLPLVGALIVTTLTGTVLDAISGDRSPWSEAVHVIELIGMFLLWLVAGSPGWERVSGLVARRDRGVVRPTS